MGRSHARTCVCGTLRSVREASEGRSRPGHSPSPATPAIAAMSPTARAVLAIIALCLLSAALTKHVVTRRCGLTYRLACMLPLIALDVTLPAVLFDPATSLLPTAIASALLSFWKTLKLVGVVLHRGTVVEASERGWSVPAIAALLLLPVNLEFEKPRARAPRAASSIAECTWRLVVKLVLLSVVVHALTAFTLLEFIAHVGQAFGLYLFLGALMDGLAGVCLLLDGGAVRLQPHFDAPYLSTSVADFWALRWNLFAAGLLRTVVFDPIVALRSGSRPAAENKPSARARPSAARRVLATLATFGVSGAAHELVFFHLTGAPTYRLGWYCFFQLNGVLVILERVLWLRSDLFNGAPAAARILFTLGLEMAIAEWLFFPPVSRVGLDARVIEDIKVSFDTVFAM